MTSRKIFRTAEDMIRARLEKMVEKTKAAAGIETPGWWEGDTAGRRKVFDDVNSGRIFWKDASDSARRGIEALDRGDMELAQTYLWAATDYYIAALETRVRPSDMAVLTKPAKRRGRPGKK